MVAVALWENGLPVVQWAVVLVAAAIAAATDLQDRRIPNALTFPLILTGPIFAGVIAGWPGVLDSVLAIFLLGIPFILMYAMAGGGAGDAKLMAGIGAWLGLVAGFITLCTVAIAGMILAVCYAVAYRKTGQAMQNLKGMTIGLVLVAFRVGKLSEVSASADSENMQKIPYGLAIFAGTVLAGSGVWIWHI
jgi:prepilin peptidase CpaA